LTSFRSNYDRSGAAVSSEKDNWVFPAVGKSAVSRDLLSSSVMVGRPFKPVGVPAICTRSSEVSPGAAPERLSRECKAASIAEEYLSESPVPRHSGESSPESSQTDESFNENPLEGIGQSGGQPSRHQRQSLPSLYEDEDELSSRSKCSTTSLQGSSSNRSRLSGSQQGATVRSLGFSHGMTSVGGDTDEGSTVRKRFSLDSFRKPDDVAGDGRKFLLAETTTQKDSSVDESDSFSVASSMEQNNSGNL